MLLDVTGVIQYFVFAPWNDSIYNSIKTNCSYL